MTAGRPQPVLSRLALGVLAVGQGVVGGWALLAPARFFAGFPGGGQTWVAALPPYNEHLVRDVGALSLALAVTLGWAAARASRHVARMTAVAFAVYCVPHTLFHLAHLEALPASAGIAQTAGLALQLAAVLLVVVVCSVRRQPGRGPRGVATVGPAR